MNDTQNQTGARTVWSVSARNAHGELLVFLGRRCNWLDQVLKETV